MTQHTAGEPEAGRELDAAVAERVMGWTHAETHADYGMGEVVRQLDYNGPPWYSTSISAAWEVVEKVLYPKGWAIAPAPETDGECWTVWDIWSEITPREIAQAHTAPLAICRAALKAVERAGQERTDAA